jgi:hypothetical protein
MALQQLCDILPQDVNEATEDLALNILSCLSNVLYFVMDVSPALARGLLGKCLHIVPQSENPEVRIEVLRIFGNLTRTPALVGICAELGVPASLYKFLEGPQCSFRECFYGVGTLINLAGDQAIREREMYEARLDLILKKLAESDFEDLELTKTICKLLTNLCDAKSASKWHNEQLEKVDKILTAIADECDSSLVSCSTNFCRTWRMSRREKYWTTCTKS